MRGEAGRRPRWRPALEPDRRKYARIATDQVISFAQVDESDRLALGRDVSAGGIRFEAVGCEVDLGEVLRLTFNVDGETVVAVGRVVWATELDPITLDIGIEFVEIDPRAARLLDDFSGAASV
jgi:hypothetical protein